MEYIELIKEACENHTIPDIVWVEEVETLLENILLQKAQNVESVSKYAKSEKGREKRRQAQKAYYHREKAKKQQEPEPPLLVV
jgi:stalled ribosome rescue protein Dom34